jgi:hypothetical protein
MLVVSGTWTLRRSLKAGPYCAWQQRGSKQSLPETVEHVSTKGYRQEESIMRDPMP